MLQDVAASQGWSVCQLVAPKAIKLVTLCCRRMVLQDLAATRESPGDELRAEPSTEMAGRAGESRPASHNIEGQSFSAALELEVCLVMLVVSAVRDAAAPQCSTHGCLAFCHDNLRDVSAQGRRCSALDCRLAHPSTIRADGRPIPDTGNPACLAPCRMPSFLSAPQTRRLTRCLQHDGLCSPPVQPGVLCLPYPLLPPQIRWLRDRWLISSLSSLHALTWAFSPTLPETIGTLHSFHLQMTFSVIMACLDTNVCCWPWWGSTPCARLSLAYV